MVYTFPIWVWKPKDKGLHKALFAGKYGTTVYKVQLGITFLDKLCCTGPHLPCYDGHIWNATEEFHPQEPWEWWIGGTTLVAGVWQYLTTSPTLLTTSDGHYIACANMLTPWWKDRRLTADETLANMIISFNHAHSHR